MPKISWFQSSLARLLIGTAVIAGCLLLMHNAASFGLSRILARYSISTNSLAAANEAINLAPADSEAHRARAAVLNNLGLGLDALKEIEVAASLRPHDDSLWLEVGNLRDGSGDANSALAAFDNAVKFAPHYGHPHWQRGNLLVRLGRYDEGFNELRLAASSNRNFLPGLIDLAWGLSRQDAQVTEQSVQFEDNRTRLALARFFARHGKGAEALGQYRKISTEVPEEVRADLISSLIQTKSYVEAFELWKNAGENAHVSSLIQNGSFEQDLILDETSFGWHTLKHDGVTFALDLNDPGEGSRSLRITFEGYDNRAPVLSQLLLLKPQQEYRVSFEVKTKDLVTGGLPVLSVKDANNGQTLGTSANLQVGADNHWTALAFKFKTQLTNAVYLRVERNECSSSPCPIFGHIWLDSLNVEEIRATECSRRR